MSHSIFARSRRNVSVLVLLSLSWFTASGCKKESDLPAGDDAGKRSTPIVVDSILDHVLVIENTNSPASMQIAKYYMDQRGVKKVLQINCPDSALDAGKETLDFNLFQEAVEKPLREYLAKDSGIDYIVLNKGIPIRLQGAPIGFGNNTPSLDSYIAAFDYFEKSDSLKIVIDEGGFLGKAFVNRYWNATERFSHRKHGGYLVTRLDGYTVESALALVDSAIAGEKTKPVGTILLDALPLAEPVDTATVPLSPIKDGKTDMQMISDMGKPAWSMDLLAASMRLAKAGLPVEFDRTDAFLGSPQALMGYASWGSNDDKFVPENYASLRFAPGAIAETAVSTSGRTFLKTSGGQSLIADLIEARVTGVKGYCNEPFLPAIASPTILFDRYTQGWNLAESFYAASRFTGWEDIVIGDPLSAPYAKR